MNDGDRLRAAREKSALTQRQLADALEIDHTYLSRIERNERRMYTELADKAAKILGVSRRDILSEDEPEVPIVGYVGAGDEVINEKDPGGGISRRQLDGVAWRPGLVGLVVRGESMSGRCEPGDIILFRETGVVEHESIGSDSIVQTADGRTLFKRVYAGSTPGRFTLSSRQVPPMVDVELVWAARMVAVLPK